MIPASFRHLFIDTLQELTDLVGEDPSDEWVEWSVEYLSRSHTWYHFDGVHEDGEASSSGQAFDSRYGALATLDPGILPLALLDFNDNEFVAAYDGDRKSATQIASDFMRGVEQVAEIVRVAIEREKSNGGSTIRISTALVFVGFEKRADLEAIELRKNLALDKELVSRNWYRARMRISDAQSTVRRFWHAGRSH